MPVKPPFALTAKALLAVARRPLGDSADAAFAWWVNLADMTGPVLLPFLTRPEEYARAPIEELGLASTPLGSLTPRRGEMWVLFCFRSGTMFEALRESALRSDGFPLILEWRKGGEDSQLLSSALRVLAVQVRRQLGVDGWCLHPAFDRYGDQVDFTDVDLFSDAEHADNVASAWGALAAGLWCVTTGRYPPEWTFPTVQWDEMRGGVAGVAGLKQKLSVAADCGAAVVTVARSQRRETIDCMRNGRAEVRPLPVFAARTSGSVKEVAEDIAMGFVRRKHRRWAIAIVNLAVLVVAIAALCLQHQIARRKIARQVLKSAETVLTREAAVGMACEEGVLQAWRSLRDALPDAEAKQFAIEQLERRNWLIPISVRSCCATNCCPYPSCLVPYRGECGNLMFWIPCDFVSGKMYFWINADEWCSAELPKGTELWRHSGADWGGVETCRVAPCGLAAVYEIALPDRHLITVDPFTGEELWRSRMEGRITAFAFSHDGNRFAFATDDGSVRVWRLMDGVPVVERMRCAGVPNAIGFSEDDERLSFRVGPFELCCAIVVQMPPCPDVEAVRPFDRIQIRECLEALLGIVDPAKCNLHGAGKLCRLFAEYAMCAASNRTTSVFSDSRLADVQEGLCSTEDGRRQILAFQPTSKRALMESWRWRSEDHLRKKLQEMLRKNPKLKESDITNACYFAFDDQLVEFEGNLLAFASKFHSDDEWFRRRRMMYPYWSGRDGSNDRCDHSVHLACQAELNSAKRDAWVSKCRESSARERQGERLVMSILRRLSDDIDQCGVTTLTNVTVVLSDLTSAIGECHKRGNKILALALLRSLERQCSTNVSPRALAEVRELVQKPELIEGKWCAVLLSDYPGCGEGDLDLQAGDCITNIEDAHDERKKISYMRRSMTGLRYEAHQPILVDAHVEFKTLVLPTVRNAQ